MNFSTTLHLQDCSGVFTLILYLLWSVKMQSPYKVQMVLSVDDTGLVQHGRMVLCMFPSVRVHISRMQNL